MNIDNLIKDFQTYEELKIFCESQFRQVLNLSKKIKELEEKNKELSKTQKENNNLAPISPASLVSSSIIIQDDAKTISQVQLRVLKDKAFEGELTLEEAKRVEIYNKILNQVDDKPKTLKADARTLDEADLLQLIKTDGTTQAK